MNEARINTHTFALYYPLPSLTEEKTIVITDTDLLHRISRILRLTVGDRCILFDRTRWIEMAIMASTRTAMKGTIITTHEIQPWRPAIRFLLPLLKREALVTAIYNLVQAGVQEIQLLETAKVHHTFGGTKELERLERVAIAAAEQSKNFAFPSLKGPLSWRETLELLRSTTSYVGDCAGIPLKSVLAGLEQRSADSYTLLVGPEGDFTPEEYRGLKESGVQPVQLTPTILKAETAAFYLAALFRSLSSSQ